MSHLKFELTRTRDRQTVQVKTQDFKTLKRHKES